jgi:glycosyltransferase involved in cell wall biosynthesis
MEIMISIIIPSVNDPRLKDTINNIKQKAKGEIEIISAIDEPRKGMRYRINDAVSKSHGEYILKCDSHCIFDEGFDVKLLSNIEDNWVVIPRRYFLDTEKWELMDDKPVDYDKLTVFPDKLSGVRWPSRTRQRANKMLDETMVFQGSCWIMSRKHWDWLGGLSEVGYGTFAQEPIEIALKTWLGGGKVMVNKHTWYAHKHRKFGRTVPPCSSREIREANIYSRDFWLNNRWDRAIHDINWLFRRFKQPEYEAD